MSCFLAVLLFLNFLNNKNKKYIHAKLITVIDKPKITVGNFPKSILQFFDSFIIDLDNTEL